MGSKGEQTRERVLKAITNYINDHQYPPTIREVCDMVGLKSPASVYAHIAILKEQGLLESDSEKTGKRAIRVPNRYAEIDALYLAKCKEVNDLNKQICRLTEELKQLKEEIKHGLGRESVKTA